MSTPPEQDRSTPGAAGGGAAREAGDDASTGALLTVHGARPLLGTTVVVVGAGVIGKMCALFASRAGAVVLLLDDGLLNTSSINAGWTFPYHSTDGRAEDLAIRSLDGWRRLARSETGEPLIPAHVVADVTAVVQRATTADPIPAALERVPGYRRLTSGEVHPDMAEGIEVPGFVIPPVLLQPVLDGLLSEMGVTRVDHHVDTRSELAALPGDVVVNATGLGAAFLLDDRGGWDEDFTPVMGTVVRVQQPDGFSGVHVWDDDTTSAPYAITSTVLGEVVIGGTTEPLTLDEARVFIEAGQPPDQRVAERLVRQIRSYAPELRDLPVQEVRTGLRPQRARMLLDADPEDPHIIHATGFGGFGVTVAPAVAAGVLERVTEYARAR